MRSQLANAGHVQEGRNRFAQKDPEATLFESSADQKALAELHHRLEFFPTPPWATRALLEAMGDQIDFTCYNIYEPCAGRGHMVEPLIQAGCSVIASDIHDHGRDYLIADAEKFDGLGPPAGSNIMITNPPFSGEDYHVHKPTLAERIVRHWQTRAGHVFVLCRLSFLVTQKRYLLMHQNPLGNLTTLLPFYDRVPMVLGRYDPAAKTATEYAWFHWRRGFTGHYTPRPIPPGTAARLTRLEDRAI